MSVVVYYETYGFHGLMFLISRSTLREVAIIAKVYSALGMKQEESRFTGINK